MRQTKRPSQSIFKIQWLINQECRIIPSPLCDMRFLEVWRCRKCHHGAWYLSEMTNRSFYSSHCGGYPPDSPAKTNHEFVEDAVLTIYDQSTENQREEDHAEESPCDISYRLFRATFPTVFFYVFCWSIDAVNNGHWYLSRKSLMIEDPLTSQNRQSSASLPRNIRWSRDIQYANIGPTGWGLRDPETGLIIDPTSEERTERGLILVNNGTEFNGTSHRRCHNASGYLHRNDTYEWVRSL
jgi:hypothetical protein